MRRGINVTERRWVSACVFALTNKLGTPVQVTLRASHPKIDSTTDTEQEKGAYPLHEGGFFGNMFLPTPVGYVCEGAARTRMLDVPVGALRLCAQPSGEAGPGGTSLSDCGFTITGRCESPSSFVVGGERVDEVIHVWLPRKLSD
jgi:hypothetical protein